MQVTVTIKRPIEPTTVTVTMTEEQAGVVTEILGEQSGKRGADTYDVYEALHNALND